MADGKVKEMSTIIFYSTSPKDHVASSEYLVNAIKADDRCTHKLFFRPIMPNVYQIIRAQHDEDGIPHIVGCHEVLYVPRPKDGSDLEDRLNRTKNVVASVNCMCIVNNKAKTNSLIDWLLEETEEIEL